MTELPTITTSAYSSATMSGQQLFADMGAQKQNLLAQNLGMRGVARTAAAAFAIDQLGVKLMPSARIVKVFIADPNENLPLDKRVLHSGEEKLTDLTDQELFFEVPIAELLAKHNEVRKATLDKKQADKFGRDVFLEPARIRDLRMVVVSVAEF